VGNGGATQAVDMNIKNRFGTERIGSRQRSLLQRMIEENDGAWHPAWYVSAEDLESLSGLIGKGIIDESWCVTEKFRNERLP
jgi:hypothetical protein